MHPARAEGELRSKMTPTRHARFLIHATACALALWVVGLGLPLPVSAAEKMNDAEKRAKIELMYRGYAREFPAVEEIGAQAAMALAKSGKVVFVDVRGKREQAVSMLPGAVTEEEFLKDMDRYKDFSVIGYCTISYRSGKLAEKLSRKGTRMLNLRGGLLAWVHEGGKVYDRNGETRRIHVYGRKWDLGPGAYKTVW